MREINERKGLWQKMTYLHSCQGIGGVESCTVIGNEKLMVVCLKLSVALGLNYPTSFRKDLDPTAASHCVSLNALFFACYANTGSHSDSNNHRSPQSHFRRHNDRTQYRLGVHPRWKTLMPGSPAINVLGTSLSLEPSVSTLGVNVPLVVQQPLPQPSLGDLVMEGFNTHPSSSSSAAGAPSTCRAKTLPWEDYSALFIPPLWWEVGVGSNVISITPSPSMGFPLFAERMLPDSGIAPARDESTPGVPFMDGKVVEILFLELI